jgi:hypothetical protein
LYPRPVLLPLAPALAQLMTCQKSDEGTGHGN